MTEVARYGRSQWEAAEEPRRALREALKARLVDMGKRWQDARLWGIEEGGFSAADCTPQYPNPAVMAGYLEWLEANPRDTA